MAAQQGRLAPAGSVAVPTLAVQVGLSALTVVGYATAAGLTIWLSQQMTATDFRIYAFTASAFLLARALGPLGADRLALQVLSGLGAGRGAEASGPEVAAFWGYALRRAAVGAAIGMAGIVLSGLAAGEGALGPAVLSASGLPLVVALHLLSVRSLIAGRIVRAALAARALPAVVAAMLIGLISVAGLPIGPGVALLCWGGGWSVAALVLWPGLDAVRLSPERVNPPPEWAEHATGFVVQTLLLSIMIRSPILLAGFLSTDPGAVATLTVSFALAGLAGVLAPVLDAPLLRAAHRARSELAAGQMRAVVARRTATFGVVGGLPALALVIASPHLAQGLTGTADQASVITIVLVTLGTAAVSFSGFPRKLLVGRADQPWKIRLLAACATGQILLLWLLVGVAGAAGAALAFCLTSIVLAVAIVRRARKSAWNAGDDPDAEPEI